MRGMGGTERLADLGELEVLDRLRLLFEGVGSGVVLGIGDDAAVFQTSGQRVLLTVDTAVEGVDFRLDWMDWRTVGWRAVAAALSDIAAMGGEAGAILLSLTAPPDRRWEEVEECCRGIRALAEEYDLPVVGGDLSRSEGLVILTVAVMGAVPAEGWVGRSTAQAGERVWVTGGLGGPALALVQLKSGRVLAPDHPAVARFLSPRPRLEEARFLVREGHPSAMIDLSDGLARDAYNLGRASSLQLVLDAELLPILTGVEDTCEGMGVDPLDLVLGSGEEFELLFTAPPGQIEAVQETFSKRYSIPLTAIGETRPGEGLILRSRGEERALESEGWDQFVVQ